MRNKLARFQPHRLRQARHRKRLTMTDVANLIGVSPQMVSVYERGESEPSPKKLRELAKRLDIPERFLTLPVSEFEQSRSSIFSYRTLASSTRKARHQAEAYFELKAYLLSLAIKHVELPPVVLPQFDIADYMALDPDWIEDIAEKTRRFFNLGDGPISDVTLLLENHGVAVSYVSLHDGMDGVCTWFDDRPMILINRRFTCVRRRFDLAHELAHLILHRNAPDEEQQKREVLKKMETDAHRFASAFLMPEKTISEEVYGIDIPSLTQVKKRWKVSIAAIIYRLHDLKIISEHQKQRLFQRLSAGGMRKKEPLDDELAVEDSLLIRRIFEFLDQNKVLRLDELLATTRLPQDFIEWVTGFSESVLLSTPPNNVIRLKPAR